MNNNEHIEIVILGDKQGCHYNDKIWIEISPRWLEEITCVYKQKALKNKDYASQGFDRQKADFFNKAYEVWRTARNEFDSKDVQKVKERN